MRARRLVVAVLCVIAAGTALRLFRIDEPPLEFQVTRQYHDALIARKYLLDLGGHVTGIPDAAVRAAAPAELEPPLLNGLTAVAWRAGVDGLWFPRVVSIALWALGGWFVFALLRRIASGFAGLVGAATWMFLPFAVTASRVFQPEPAMVVASLAAILALVREDDAPGRRRLWAAGALAGLAVLVKLPAAFAVVPVFVALTVRRSGWSALWSRRSVVFGALAVGPALAWNLYGLTIGGFLRSQDPGRSNPGLLLDDRFWRGWAHVAHDAYGVIVPIAAIVGILVARGRARWLGAALVIGYLAYGVVFNDHYMTHDYYHLPFVGVAAVGIGLLADRVAQWVRAGGSERWTGKVAAAVAIGAVVLVGFIVGIDARYPLVPPAVTPENRRALLDAPRRVGDAIDHSTSVVSLTPDFGYSLEYYGGIAGTEWIDRSNGDAGSADALAQARRSGAEYVVVTDLATWRARPGLRAALREYPQVPAGPGARVFDLTDARR